MDIEMATTGDLERRSSNRIPCRTPVRVYADSSPASESYTLMASSLTSESVFLHSDFLLSKGEELELEYMVPGRTLPVRGNGKVVRVEGGTKSQRGEKGSGMAILLY